MSQSASDFDFNTDQSTRVARRVAHGVYRLTHADADIGEELWSIFALRNGNYRLMTEIDLLWPVPHQQRTHLDVNANWAVQALWAQVDLNHTRRMATYTPNGAALDIEITETRVHAEEEHSSKHKMRKVMAPGITAGHTGASPGKIVLRRRVAFTASTHLDFASVLFNFVALQRLQLPQQGRATFDAVVLMLPSLEPLQVSQTYHYERDEVLADLVAPPPVPRIVAAAPPQEPRAQLPARRYTITEIAAAGDPAGTVTTFWTDAHGIAIRQELSLDGAPHRCEVVSYQWRG